MTPRDIEKLRAIGYEVKDNGVTPGSDWQPDRLDIRAYRGGWSVPGTDRSPEPHERDEGIGWVWAACKAHAQSPEGMKATMADKVRFLDKRLIFRPEFGGWSVESFPAMAEGKTPEAAVDALFWSVP